MVALAANDLLRRIARVFEEKIGDKNQAFDALVNAFSEDARAPQMDVRA